MCEVQPVITRVQDVIEASSDTLTAGLVVAKVGPIECIVGDDGTCGQYGPVVESPPDLWVGWVALSACV